MIPFLLFRLSSGGAAAIVPADYQPTFQQTTEYSATWRQAAPTYSATWQSTKDYSGRWET